MSASPIACLTTAITMADQMQTMLEKVRTSWRKVSGTNGAGGRAQYGCFLRFY